MTNHEIETCTFLNVYQPTALLLIISKQSYQEIFKLSEMEMNLFKKLQDDEVKSIRC